MYAKNLLESVDLCVVYYTLCILSGFFIPPLYPCQLLSVGVAV